MGEFYVRCSGIKPGELPLVVGAGAIGLSTVAALEVARRQPDRGVRLQRRPARVRQDVRRRRPGQPVESRDPYEVWRETFRANNFQTTQVIFECVGKNGLLQSIVDSCEFMARVYVAGGWYDAGTIDCTDATHKGMTIQFGGGPHPQDWYGTLDAVADGRLDPSPSIGRIDRPRRSARGHRPGAQGPGTATRHRASDRLMTVLPGPMRQIGYVVTDLDRAIDGWLELGVGPWFVMRGLPMQRALPRRAV